jgi:hypothetical protein
MLTPPYLNGIGFNNAKKNLVSGSPKFLFTDLPALRFHGFMNSRRL